MVGKPQSAEMHPGPGFRLRYEIERPDPETVSGLSRHQTPDISDLMNRLYAMEPEIRNMTDPDLRQFETKSGARGEFTWSPDPRRTTHDGEDGKVWLT